MGQLYERYHRTAYNPAEVAAKVRELYESFYVKEKKGIYEYILDGCQMLCKTHNRAKGNR